MVKRALTLFFLLIFLVFKSNEEALFIFKALCFFSIATVGIFHGSNDLELSKRSKLPQNLLGLLLLYTGLGMLIILFYFVSIEITLSVFILLSAYHFGEESFAQVFSKENFILKLYFLLLGVNTFSLLFYGNLQETNSILNKIDIASIDSQVVKSVVIVVCIMQFMVCMFLSHAASYGFKRFLMMQLDLVLLGVAFFNLDLLFSFSLYFVVWHSLPAMNNQSLMAIKNRGLSEVTKFFLPALPYYIISIVGAISIFYFTEDASYKWDVYIVLLMFVTVPHILSIARIYDFKRKSC